MNQQELHTLERIIKETEHPSVPGTELNFDGVSLVHTKSAELVEGIENNDLLSDPKFKAGYKRAWKEIKQRLTWLFLNGTPTSRRLDQIKYAGRPKPPKGPGNEKKSSRP